MNSICEYYYYLHTIPLPFSLLLHCLESWDESFLFAWQFVLLAGLFVFPFTIHHYGQTKSPLHNDDTLHQGLTSLTYIRPNQTVYNVHACPIFLSFQKLVSFSFLQQSFPSPYKAQLWLKHSTCQYQNSLISVLSTL